MRALLVSTYDLGRQPFGLASPAAWLRREGMDVTCVDAAKDRLVDDEIRDASLIAFHLPMHTATRLAAPLIERARRVNPDARICAYGLYAPLNADWLRSIGVSDVVGGEFEAELASIAKRLSAAASEGGKGVGSGQPFAPIEVTRLDRLNFLVPERDGLPALARYATLRLADGATRVTGYTEASRGCRHLCRHCPVVPVYNGQFRAVPAEVVLADVDRQVAAGAQHITFGDPDFFNGPTHALRIVERLAAAHPGLTYDVTIKIEHLLRHRAALPRLRDTGCLFVTSAVESVDDRVLAFLEKGHTRADFVEAVEVCRHVGLDLVPTFVPFHPWTTRDGYGDMLETIASLDLVEHVAPIQLTIRLLIPSGSRMLELDDVQRAIGPFDGRTLAYPWRHADPSIDRLHGDVTSLVGSRLAADRRELFHAIADAAGSNARLSAPATRGIARVDEPWYCCAEPNPDQLRIV